MLKKKIWVGIGALCALLAAGPVVAQVAQDFPTLKGNNGRTGRNGDPAGTNPGAANLRWFAPNGTNAPDNDAYVVDDSDRNPVDNGPDGLPLPVNPSGFASYVKNEVTAAVPPNWVAPTIEEAASDAFFVQVRPRTDGANPRNLATRNPGYRYTRPTPSNVGNDPRLAANPTALRTFSWTLRPGTTPSRQSLYVWLPAQPTLLGGVRTFSQQYYVYNIAYGTGQNEIQVVDAYGSNGGWVRLGNGGRVTNRLYDYNGTDPIVITLYNTVPRDANGNLRLPVGVTNPSQLLVYADAAMAIPQPGYYASTPVSARRVDGDVNSTTVTAVENRQDTGGIIDSDELTTLTAATVTNYDYQGGTVRWRYTPSADSGQGITRDDEGADVVSNPLNPWISDINFPRNTGASARVSQIAGTVPNSTARYTFPVVDSGNYSVFVYLPGTITGFPLATGARYEVRVRAFDDDGNPTIVSTEVSLDQSNNRGWVRLPGRYLHNVGPEGNAAAPAPIEVVVLNSSQVAADAGTRYVYADAIRVVGEENLTVTSTPVYATALIRQARGAAPVETKVVLVADEGGRIHCLDHEGNGDGTTREYWAYPSVRDSAEFDPNHVTGEDWTGPSTTPYADRTSVSENPNGFDLSSALVQRVTVGGVQRDYLYIASTNGRIYCLDMAGRGDGDGTADPVSGGTRSVGTTTRVWTYPATYPASNAVERSNLGPFRGSLAIAQTGVDSYTIYAPTTQGRIYALDAEGTNAANKTTSVEWTFPALDQPTLGAIVNTPSVEFGKVYFGTQIKSDSTGEIPGRFYALDQATGDLVWWFQRTDALTQDPLLKRTGDFESSPITVPGSLLSPTDVNTVFTLNQNNVVYSLNADTGALIWATDELRTGAVGSLTFSPMNVFDPGGGSTSIQPCIIVPGQNGQLRGLYAAAARFNGAGTKSSWPGRDLVGGMVASSSVSNGWLYAADTTGHLYAFNNGTGLVVPGNPPGREVLAVDDPRGNAFKKAKIRLISGAMFRRLRRPDEDTAKATYQQAIDDAIAFTRDVFEWGDTAYVLVYDFPFLTRNLDNEEVDPPTVNISFTADGRTQAGIGVPARSFDRFVDSPSQSADTTVPEFQAVAPVGALPGVDPALRMNGYAVLAFPLNNSGARSVPPGAGQITFNLQTGALNSAGSLQTVQVSPTLYNPATAANSAWSRFPFQVANPLAIVVPTATGAQPAFTATSLFSLGLTANPGGLPNANPLKQETLINGSYDIAGSPKLEGNFVAPAPVAQHGTSTKTRVWVFDRSNMALLRPGGGLDQVRLERSDVRWQGGAANVLKPFNAALYPNFEDLPSRFPNDSLDYPDLAKERIRATKEPNGNTENPLFSGVTLRPPTTNTGAPIAEDTLPGNRRFQATEFEIDVDVPQFQPANFYRSVMAGLVPNSASQTAYSQGYLGQLFVYVDSINNGQRDLTSREAYRNLNLSASVAVDERISITTPTVDLGSLPGGAGYTPAEARPGTTFNPSANLDAQSTLLHPWGGEYNANFREFGAVNLGNVNLLNVRAAKRSNLDGTTLPLSILPNAGDPLAWLNGFFNIHTSIDPQFSPVPDAAGRAVIIQKPRVTDRVGIALRANPKRRENTALGTTGLRSVVGQSTPVDDVLNETLVGPVGNQSLKYPSANPRVTVSVPIGWPVGRYTTQLVLFEDSTGNNIWNNRANGGTNVLQSLPGGPEPFTDPGFTLTYNVVETRLTNSYTPKAAPMLDNLGAGAGASAARFQNSQPAAMRDGFGNVIVAFTSNRSAWTATANDATSLGQGSRLYIGSLDSGGSFAGASYGVPGEPQAAGSNLRDFGLWRSFDNGRWWRQGAASYPTTAPASLFGAGILANTVRYDSPAFPTSGIRNPFVVNGGFSNAKMVFIGRGTRSTATGQIEESRLMLANVAANGGGAVTAGAPISLANDPQVAKSEPSVLQTGDDTAALFYTGVTGGQPWIYYTDYRNGGFGLSSPLPFGRGFVSITGFSPAGRMYVGRRPDGSGSDNRPIAEATFTAQLRGRPYPEVFLGRLSFALNPDRTPVVPYVLPQNADGTLASTAFEYLPLRTGELVERESAGVYRTRGVSWQRDANVWSNQPIQLWQDLNGAITQLLLPNTRSFDNETGLISYETRLGGRVSMDPSQGTIRFTSTVPTGSARLYASYVPRFVRISESSNQGGGASKATAMFDQRFISDATFHALSNGNAVGNAAITNDRLVVMWNRAAGGSLAARPFLSSQRIGVDLGFRLPTLPDGRPGYRDGATVRPAISSISVAGYSGVFSYEVDPANGRIYLPAYLEGFPVTVNYVSVDANGNPVAAPNSPFTGTATLVTERTQEPISIETASNESALTAFLDPFSYQTDRRPSLVWLFWTSTRGGVPDLYFQTIAPRWSPAILGR